MTSMTYSYRQLTRDDLGAFRQLLRVFGEAFDDVETYQRAVPSDDYLRSLLGKPDFIVVAALDEAQVVGGLTAYVLEKYERARAEVYIYDLAVAEAHRRSGIARQLIQTLKPIAKARGAYVMFVQADPPDEAAIRLYTSMGAREDVHHFDIGVD
jgi:ribosomal protein S18 acetylase RimI-like enzyme